MKCFVKICIFFIEIKREYAPLFSGMLALVQCMYTPFCVMMWEWRLSEQISLQHTSTCSCLTAEKLSLSLFLSFEFFSEDHVLVLTTEKLSLSLSLAFFLEDCIAVASSLLLPSGHCVMNLFCWFDNRKEIKSQCLGRRGGKFPLQLSSFSHRTTKTHSVSEDSYHFHNIKNVFLC